MQETLIFTTTKTIAYHIVYFVSIKTLEYDLHTLYTLY